MSLPLYVALQAMAAVRKQLPLQYGRFYFRPFSKDGIDYLVSQKRRSLGVLAQSFHLLG